MVLPERQTEEADMGRNTSITLGDHFARFVDTQVAEGRYNSASDVVRAGLRLLEEHENHVAAIRAALIEGERSGKPEALDFDQFLEDLRSEPL
jgi:antitoxin ParD1/3/4